ncbi:Carboxylesterase 5A [Sporothrix bragantina]|uniref:Carboxylesterase 5A n=1 Tax=Sporothrix bragantina TaxID=671064 RepID=A0ABP0CWB7_9PEZI
MSTNTIDLDAPSLGSRVTGTVVPRSDELRCLNLNISLPTAYLPPKDKESDSTRLLPVIVWIHGGAFYFGANSTARQDPERLCQRAQQTGHPVVLVSINYRLGPLGYAASADLATEAGSAKSWVGLDTPNVDFSPIVGSFGQIDQHNAFRWVQDHIRDFGGDPRNVTAAGVSAGSASIHYHILAGNPLFDRAILMSGAAGALGPLPSFEYERAWQSFLSDSAISTHMASSMDSPANRLAALRKLPADVIVARYPRRIGIGPSADGILLPRTWSHQRKPSQSSTRCRSIITGDSQHESIILEPLIKATVPSEFYQRAQDFFSPPEVAEGFLAAFGFHTYQSRSAFQEAYRIFLAAVMFQHPALGLADSFPGESFYYHLDEPSPYDGPTTGLAAHALCSMLLFLNDVEKYPACTRATAEHMADTWTAFAHGVTPWDCFCDGRRFWRFGPGGSGSLTSFPSDSQRAYGYQDWLEKNYDQTVAFCRGIFSQDWGR